MALYRSNRHPSLESLVGLLIFPTIVPLAEGNYTSSGLTTNSSAAAWWRRNLHATRALHAGRGRCSPTYFTTQCVALVAQ